MVAPAFGFSGSSMKTSRGEWPDDAPLGGSQMRYRFTTGGRQGKAAGHADADHGGQGWSMPSKLERGRFPGTLVPGAVSTYPKDIYVAGLRRLCRAYNRRLYLLRHPGSPGPAGGGPIFAALILQNPDRFRLGNDGRPRLTRRTKASPVPHPPQLGLRSLPAVRPTGRSG